MSEERQKAIETLKEHLAHWERLLKERICDETEGKNTIEAFKMSIASLETDEVYQLMEEQPELCEDCISREYVEEMIDRCYAASWNENDFYDRLMAELEVTPSVLFKAKWIPVSERLPQEAFGCLVTVIDTDVHTQEEFENILPYFVGYDGETWNDADGESIPFEVIAWMPLPQPYREVEE